MNTARISSGGPDVILINPDIWDNRITWTDGRNGDKDIYLFTIGIEMPPLSADFIVNTTQGENPLSVAFTDTSTGQIEGWHWDFGDGSGSVEQNPVHTYVSPGSYSVTLNIHNQWQRNGIYKADFISAGSGADSAVFRESDKWSGIQPVQFADESSGLPTEWQWELGWGNIRRAEPILHLSASWVYNVSLIVGISLAMRR